MYIREGVWRLRAQNGPTDPIVKKRYQNVTVQYGDETKLGQKLILSFPFDLWLKDWVKGMAGSAWDVKTSKWSILDCQRNLFRFLYLSVDHPDPYIKYDKPLSEIKVDTRGRDLYRHQLDMAAHILARGQALIAGEPGTGKTLAAIVAMENARPKWPVYIAPKFALQNIRNEYKKWGSVVQPDFLTYDQMKKFVPTLEGHTAPDFVVFDESHQIMHPTTERSRMARALADGVRQDHKFPYIIPMSGTPAPCRPENWWHQAEVACPGYLIESSEEALKHRLALITLRNEETGEYPKQITYWDDCRKCAATKEISNSRYKNKKVFFCGAYRNDPVHEHGHPFVESKNEVEFLYTRLQGLTYFALKKDCLDLPEKIFQTIRLEPSPSLLRAMSLITSRCPTVIEALTLTRELSDGFQYVMEKSDKQEICPVCHGKGIDPNNDNSICFKCEGSGQIDVMVRTTKEIPCPKLDALSEIIDEVDDIGRIVIFAGFTASIDRVCSHIRSKHGWDIIRADGRGVDCSFKTDEFAINYFQDKSRKIPKIAFVAQPGVGGVSLTLTEANTAVFYSNTFLGTDRIQASDRIHRIGADPNRGVRILDLVHLPTDDFILDNLNKKVALQGMTMGDLTKYINQRESF